MSIASSLHAGALAILDQVNALRLEPGAARAVDIAAIANGSGPGAYEGGHVGRARARVAEALFSPNSLDVTKMKLHLIERLGDELGIPMSDFDTLSAFGSAIRKVVAELRTQPDGPKRLAQISESLGLDKLGISLDTLIGAIVEPGGPDDEKLEAALKAELADNEGAKRDAAAMVNFRIDEAGIYGG